LAPASKSWIATQAGCATPDRFVFTNRKSGAGVDKIVDFVTGQGGLEPPASRLFP